MSKIENYVDPIQINKLKTILSQSEAGIHLLFDNELISHVFSQEFDEEYFFQVETLKSTQDHLINLIKKTSLIEKKDYIRNLSVEDQNLIVRAYFFIIESNIKKNQKRPH